MAAYTMAASSSAAAYTPDVTSTASSSSSASYSMATYGSGSSNWGSGYNDCVKQCIADFGSPDATYTATPTATMGSHGTGATHTVIVAPTQGVLRYVPAMVNASVGDTVMFKWQANNHTVTKGSALELCNKTSDAPFASGLHDKDFVFTQVVNDTNPTYFFCAAPNHCQKGMFGIINMPSASGASSSAGAMMGTLVASSPELKAMQALVDEKVADGKSPVAARWGSNANFSALPEWAHTYMAENIAYSRLFLASNPDVITEDGRVDLGMAKAPLMWPTDAGNAMRNAPAVDNAASSPSSASESASATASSASASASAAESNSSNGAGALAPSVLFALVAVAATVFVL
jgi:plastocyanin